MPMASAQTSPVSVAGSPGGALPSRWQSWTTSVSRVIAPSPAACTSGCLAGWDSSGRSIRWM
jgi:hypothetical protein